jgi:hypothetical protein
MEYLNSFLNVFKTLGFVCSFLTFNLIFCLRVLLLLVLLHNIWSILLLGFALLRYMSLLMVGLQFMLVGLMYLLLFRIILGWLGRTVFSEYNKNLKQTWRTGKVYSAINLFLLKSLLLKISLKIRKSSKFQILKEQERSHIFHFHLRIVDRTIPHGRTGQPNNHNVTTTAMVEEIPLLNPSADIWNRHNLNLTINAMNIEIRWDFI